MAGEPMSSESMTGEPNHKPDPANERGDSTAAATDAVLATATQETELGADGDMDRLRQDLDDAKSRVLRAQADLENFRKRARREQEEERRYANWPLLSDLLPVIDNVGRAIQAAEKAADAGTLLEGVKLVAQQLVGVLTRYHCTRIVALGAAFDPHLHQAILQQPSAELPLGTVLVVAQEGYQLHDRVLRPAQVIVSSGPPAEEQPAAPAT
jgi:molecular chaperone GrpE